MSGKSPSPSSTRAIGVLFAIGVLIAFAGLAGLGATVIFDTAPSLDPVGSRASLHPVRIHEMYGYADSLGRMVTPPSAAPLSAAPLAVHDGNFR